MTVEENKPDDAEEEAETAVIADDDEEESENKAVVAEGNEADDEEEEEEEETVDNADSDEEDAKNENKVKKEKIPQRIALLGERNTGTRWMTSQLTKCFPTIKVTSRLIRWKHWFQEDDHKSHNPTLVIAQFRNIFEWTEAMRNVPHHSPYHLKLSWQEFVRRPWTMPRPKRDLVHKDSDGQVCYEKFRYNELVSCVEGSYEDEDYKEWMEKTGYESKSNFSGHKPIYELKQDGSGEPFSSILEMRAAKIRNFLSIKDWDWVQDSIPVQYEKLLAEGTDFLITQIEEKLQIKRSCEAVPPQQRKKRELPPDYVEWMRYNVDWESENLIGYTKDDHVEVSQIDDAFYRGDLFR